MLSDRNADSPVFDQPADQRSTTTTVPPAPAAVVDDAPMIILAPLADSDIRVTSPGVLAWDTSGAASGAVVAPDGTVYSIAVSPHPSWLPDTADWEAIPPRAP